MTDARTILGSTARGLAASIREGTISAGEALDTYLAHIGRTDPQIGAYLRTDETAARASAEAIDAARKRGDTLGRLAGVPFGLKDIFITRGLETTCGSKILAGFVPPFQGTHTARLLDAGGVLVGKLAMDEFAMGSSNENTPFTPVRNPWARDHVPGGSSGGSAAAVAARTTAFTLGTDTGGSIRQPASLCGVVGLKPTWGRVSRYGMIAFASSLDQAGPMTRDVRDAALILETIAGPDAMDATCLPDPVPSYLAACEAGCAGMKIGVHRASLAHEGLDPEVRRAFERALEVLTSLGATLVDVDLPHYEYATACYYVLCTAEASSNLARFDGVRYGLRVDRESLLETYCATREAGFGAEVKRRIMLGAYVLRADSYEEYYGRAMRVRTSIGRDYDAAFATCDVIVGPTSPVPGFRLGERVADPLAMYLSDVFTIGANLAGLPAMSLPCGFSQATTQRPSLPIGLHLVAPRLAEARLLACAAAFEDAAELRDRIAPEIEAAIATA